MSQPTITGKTKVFDFLNDQIDSISLQKTLKLNHIRNLNLPLNEIIEYIYQFLNSFDPPFEIEKLSLSHNQLDELPLNIKLLSKHVRYLDLHDNYFNEVPIELTDFNLEFLDLSNNRLNYLSKTRMSKLQNLKLINLKNNKFKYLPPVLGELPYLNLIEVANNPLVFPSMEMINKFQKQTSVDWVKELKQFLITNSSVLESKIYESLAAPAISASTTPQISRSKSISETKTKASKAARRMGLIIKKPEEEQSNYNNNDFPSPLNLPNSSSSIDTSFAMSPQVSNVGTTTTTTAISTSSSNPHLQTSSPPLTPTIKPRSRSNTLVEIDKMLDDEEDDHKSGAYFRRLSTLAEVPVDEIISHNRKPKSNPPNVPLPSFQSSATPTTFTNANNSSTSSTTVTNGSSATLNGSSSVNNGSSSNFGTPSASQVPQFDSPKKKLDDLIHVSRKVLFAFSELHSSIRRFSGFCSDKKITIKMVSLLYTAKSNIDSLVEALELEEDTLNGQDKISECLHSCITSFKSIMSVLGDNFLQFTAKIDVCFIRMLYLTIFGAFNELFNAYKILNKDRKIGLSINTSLNTMHGSLLSASAMSSTQESNVNVDNVEDVDEQLYQSIEIASTKAQDVFGELTRAISKSAIASAQDSNSEISSSLAAKVKDLTTVCVTSMDIIKQLRTKLITIRNNPSFTTKKLFWDDINMFLKTIIQTFSSVKNLMKDLPILNDIRSSMAKLTKSTKDVTILLEASSYKAIDSSQTHPPPLALIPSVSNIFTPLSAHPNHHLHALGLQVNLSAMQPPVRTPLVAALGPAAQAIMPLSEPTTVHSLNPPHVPGSPTISPQVNETSGQYFANNGINPFDGLIMANSGNRETTNKDKEDL